jgi:hypothetical protein
MIVAMDWEDLASVLGRTMWLEFGNNTERALGFLYTFSLQCVQGGFKHFNTTEFNNRAQDVYQARREVNE